MGGGSVNRNGAESSGWVVGGWVVGVCLTDGVIVDHAQILSQVSQDVRDRHGKIIGQVRRHVHRRGARRQDARRRIATRRRTRLFDDPPASAAAGEKTNTHTHTHTHTQHTPRKKTRKETRGHRLFHDTHAILGTTRQRSLERQWETVHDTNLQRLSVRARTYTHTHKRDAASDWLGLPCQSEAAPGMRVAVESIDTDANGSTRCAFCRWDFKVVSHRHTHSRPLLIGYHFL